MLHALLRSGAFRNHGALCSAHRPSFDSLGRVSESCQTNRRQSRSTLRHMIFWSRMSIHWPSPDLRQPRRLPTPALAIWRSPPAEFRRTVRLFLRPLSNSGRPCTVRPLVRADQEQDKAKHLAGRTACRAAAEVRTLHPDRREWRSRCVDCSSRISCKIMCAGLDILYRRRPSLLFSIQHARHSGPMLISFPHRSHAHRAICSKSRKLRGLVRVSFAHRCRSMRL